MKPAVGRLIMNKSGSALELYLVRHTRPDVPEGLCYGRTDVPLDEADLARGIERIAQHLPRGLPFHSSPSSRCTRLQTALANGTDGMALAPDPRLMELDFGAWEGQLWNALPRHETERWTRDIVDEAPPGGERLRDMVERVEAFATDLRRSAAEQGAGRIGIVGHAGSLKVLLLAALGLPPSSYGSIDKQQGRVSRIDIGAAGTMRVIFVNR